MMPYIITVKELIKLNIITWLSVRIHDLCQMGVSLLTIYKILSIILLTENNTSNVIIDSKTFLCWFSTILSSSLNLLSKYHAVYRIVWLLNFAWGTQYTILQIFTMLYRNRKNWEILNQCYILKYSTDILFYNIYTMYLHWLYMYFLFQ